ncbi:hypothetical protein [Dyella sp. GSA-30]|uniref:hypothetical protein n=1 Tax=Dyella sp. GSA-30 TaxID=2994496 RepID=UPI002493122F|nr:hypothetical protein [Dyella sp. GSA-30]BDU22505.1 hypothetical protein DYGSA30_39620 [Dyella sp. GSA-30]
MEDTDVDAKTVIKAHQDRSEKEFKKAKLECMRNMATMTAYSFGSSYLFFQRPKVLGSPLISVALGGILFFITLWGVASTAEIFLDAAIERHIDIRNPKWQSGRRKVLLFCILMAIFLCFATVPYLVMELPRK